MKFYLKDTQQTKEITMKEWNGSCYNPDCFYDMEICFPEDHPERYEDEYIVCTSKEYEELKDWWEEEVAAMNAGENGQNGADYSEQPNENIFLFAD